jgi:hypothetical protein
MPPNARNHDFDDERLDCGHYEYLSRAVPTPQGFLICASCHAALMNPRRPEHASHARLGLIGFANKLGRFLACVSALWRAGTKKEQNV